MIQAPNTKFKYLIVLNQLRVSSALLCNRNSKIDVQNKSGIGFCLWVLD